MTEIERIRRETIKAFAKDIREKDAKIASLITTIESQKADVQYLEGDIEALKYDNKKMHELYNKHMIESVKRGSEIESLKAITELAVKGLEYVVSFPFLEPNDDTRTIKRQCHITLTDIKRLSHET